MKGNVFIGWNISSVLATHVKEQLKRHGYNAIVGGKENDEVEHGVGATIIAQMKKCSSAIMLFSARPIPTECPACGAEAHTEILSGNMLYELGYLTGSLKIKRVLTVYIDRAAQLAPSDLQGGWDFRISSDDGRKPPEELAQEIVAFFLAEQKDCLNENKMEMITDVSNLRAILIGHMSNPVYYETEIATIVMLFCQSAYMVGDMENSEKVLRELLHSGIKNECCLLAIGSSFDYFDACRALTKNEYDNMYLPKRDYKRLLANFSEYVEEAETSLDEDDPFRDLFLMITYDYLTFINMMHYSDVPPEELDEDVLLFRERCAKRSIHHSTRYRAQDPQRNAQLCALYESYTYRNLALFYRSMKRYEEANEYFERSISSRRELYLYFKKRDLNQSVFDQVNMEYHLSLIDNIFDTDDAERAKRKRELRDYVEDANEAAYNRRYLIDKISSVLEQLKRPTN